MAEEVRYKLLDEPLLSVSDAAGRHTERVALPELYAALVRGTVGDFAAVRPHQRHVWHAFLVQVGALALHAAGLTEPPDDAGAWRALLLALTPDDPDGAAWALVAPHARPALLQPPVPDGNVSTFGNIVPTPDALDMLVTSKNHDVKRYVMQHARPEHWVYALVSLQTQEGGYRGKGKHGVSRMNSATGNRPGIGISVLGNPGARLVRDVGRLTAIRQLILEEHPDLYHHEGGVGLTWTVPWDGNTPLSLGALDVYFVEVCRRVRMFTAGDVLFAYETSSAPKKEDGQRISATPLRGNLGDPWTPVVSNGEGSKALTLSLPGFSYRRMRSLILPTSEEGVHRAALSQVAATDRDEGLVIVARAVIRGDTTDGFHERYVPISEVLRRFIGATVADEAAAIGHDRVSDVGEFTKFVLHPALRMTFSSERRAARDNTGAHANATNAVNNEKASTTRERDRRVTQRINQAAAPFERFVDGGFFADLDLELAVLGDSEAMTAQRGRWLLSLRRVGRKALLDALASAPTIAAKYYSTQIRALRRFDMAFRHHFGDRVQTGGAANA